MNNQKPTKGTEMTTFGNNAQPRNLMNNPYVINESDNNGYGYPQPVINSNYNQNAQYGVYAGTVNHNAYQNYSYGGYQGQQPDNAYTTSYSSAMHSIYQSQPFTEDYFKKKIENPMIKKTELAGSTQLGTVEFDDYFEKHVEKFFTPEINEMMIYHHQGYIFGMQFIYRDSWGKTNKETYKGDLHMADNVDKNNCECAKLALAYDEYVKEMYVEASDYVTFLKFVTNTGKVLEIGKPTRENKNIVGEHGKVLGIGGTFNVCLNSVYFYYT